MCDPRIRDLPCLELAACCGCALLYPTIEMWNLRHAEAQTYVEMFGAPVEGRRPQLAVVLYDTQAVP